VKNNQDNQVQSWLGYIKPGYTLTGLQ